MIVVDTNVIAYLFVPGDVPLVSADRRLKAEFGKRVRLLS